MELRGRLPVLVRTAIVAATAILSALLAGGMAPARAAVFMTQDQALAQAFPGARIERRAWVLTPAQQRALQQLAKVRVTSKLATAYHAWRGDSLLGTAFFDSRTVRTMPAVILVTVRPDTTVGTVEVLAFHEPPEYLPPARWRDRFADERLDDRLWPHRDVKNLAGATLSTRAFTESVRLSLAMYQLFAAPVPPLARRRP